MGNDAARLAASCDPSIRFLKFLENISWYAEYIASNKRACGWLSLQVGVLVCYVFFSVHIYDRSQTLNMGASHLDQQLHLDWLDKGFHSHNFLKQGI